MEHHGGLVGVDEEELAEDIEDDGDDDKGSKANADLLAQGKFLELLGERVARDLVEESHA